MMLVLYLMYGFLHLFIVSYDLFLFSSPVTWMRVCRRPCRSILRFEGSSRPQPSSYRSIWGTKTSESTWCGWRTSRVLLSSNCYFHVLDRGLEGSRIATQFKRINKLGIVDWNQWTSVEIETNKQVRNSRLKSMNQCWDIFDHLSPLLALI